MVTLTEDLRQAIFYDNYELAFDDLNTIYPGYEADFFCIEEYFIK